VHGLFAPGLFQQIVSHGKIAAGLPLYIDNAKLTHDRYCLFPLQSFFDHHH
jgi:hypothetical protein